jgi:predicted CoA-substrate-specific enzyme activase
MTKVVILKNNDMVVSEIAETGSAHKTLAYMTMAAALKKAGYELDSMDFIVGTGYGRLNIPFADKQITEITCHAKGIAALFPEARTVIEIGGQDCKCIQLEHGKVVNFTMNEKCAAGTGRFLQIVADMLEFDLDGMNKLAVESKGITSVSNYCAIFAQQEIISALSMDIPVEYILAGLFESFARRLVKMAQTQRIFREVVITGGGSKHRALRLAIEKILGYSILVPQEPLLTGAYGAALMAADQVAKGEQRKERVMDSVLPG